MKDSKPLWNPYVSGIALGLVLLGSFVITGKGLGGSGAIKRLSATVLHVASPTWAEENKLVGGYFGPKKHPLDNWIVFLSVGVLVGGFVASVTGRRFGLETIRGHRIGKNSRLILALVGGILAGLGCQIARGCASGQILTGGSQLALGSWVVMVGFFSAAFAAAFFVRKQWI